MLAQTHNVCSCVRSWCAERSENIYESRDVENILNLDVLGSFVWAFVAPLLVGFVFRFVRLFFPFFIIISEFKIYYLVFTMCLFLSWLRRHVCRPIIPLLFCCRTNVFVLCGEVCLFHSLRVFFLLFFLFYAFFLSLSGCVFFYVSLWPYGRFCCCCWCLLAVCSMLCNTNTSAPHTFLCWLCLVLNAATMSTFEIFTVCEQYVRAQKLYAIWMDLSECMCASWNGARFVFVLILLLFFVGRKREKFSAPNL